LSREVTNSGVALKGKLHTVMNVGLGSGWVMVYEVPKGTIPQPKPNSVR